VTPPRPALPCHHRHGHIYRTETLALDSNGAIVGRTIRNASGVAICNESFGRDDADRMTNFTAGR
jgi:hypothetical protein